MTPKVLVLIFLSTLSTLYALPAAPTLYQLTEPVDHAESPTWDSRNNLLYYVNIHEGQILRYNYETKQLSSIKLNGEIAPVVPSKRDPYVLIAGLDLSVVAVRWEGDSPPSQTRVLDHFSAQFPRSRVNEGKADKQGRFWLGTMALDGSNGQGLLYEVTCGNIDNPKVELSPVSISNGLAWNKANDKFFYIDTPTNQVVRYNYNDQTGDIRDKSVVFDMQNHVGHLTGSPDGMTIDENDNLWIALYGGGAVIHVDSTNGDLLQIVTIPADDVTSAMWGGPNLDQLFVTTSRVSLTEQQKQQQPSAGAVFVVSGLGTKGVPVYEVDLLESIDGPCVGK